jgi:hypothetical protein
MHCSACSIGIEVAYDDLCEECYNKSTQVKKED